MKLHLFIYRESDNDDLYEFRPELGLSTPEAAQMREADALNEEILASTGGEKIYAQWARETAVTGISKNDDILH